MNYQSNKKVILFVANRAEFFCSHRIPIADAARARGMEVHVATPRDPYVSKLEERGFTWHSYDLKGKSMNPIYELRTLVDLYKLYSRLQPHLVHHVAVKAVLYGGLAARMARVPNVVNAFTGLGYLFASDSWKVRIARWMVFQLARVALNQPGSRTIFQNPDDVDEFVKRGVLDERRVRLIRGSGVDMDTFQPSEEPSGRPVVMLASRLVWDKGVGEFVKAARALKKRGHQARFVLVGKSDPLNPNAVPENRLKAWDYEGPVEWWGYQEDMPAVFEDVHIVCLPSYYREGVPKVLIEAAACKRPIVTTNMPGCREIVHDGKNGLLVPPEDSVALAEALEKMLSSPKRREEMGEAGRQLVEKEFSLESVVEETVKVYKEMLQLK